MTLARIARIAAVAMAIIVISTDARGQVRGTTTERVTVRLAPGINGPLHETERVEETEHRVDGEVRQEVTGFLRDVNGRWQATSERIVTTTTTDGERSWVEEVKAPNPVAASDPMRVIQRTMTTARRIGPDRWRTERQVFELDVNGRMVLVEVSAETSDSMGR